jgi:ketosteroid isomerase-like protein
MSDSAAIADRVEIEALRAEYSDAAMMCDYNRLASLFTEDGVMRWPHGGLEFTGREAIAAVGAQREQHVDYLVQTTHPGFLRLDGDTASGRAYIHEIIRLRDGSSHMNYAIYHDRYQRTPGGWKFSERVYDVRYLDTTPLAGSVPRPDGEAR